MRKRPLDDIFESLISAYAILEGMDMDTMRRLRDRDLAQRDALHECLEYFRDNQDVVDGPDGQPMPDKCMRLANLCEEALS